MVTFTHFVVFINKTVKAYRVCLMYSTASVIQAREVYVQSDKRFVNKNSHFSINLKALVECRPPPRWVIDALLQLVHMKSVKSVHSSLCFNFPSVVP